MKCYIHDKATVTINLNTAIFRSTMALHIYTRFQIVKILVVFLRPLLHADFRKK